MKINPNKLLNLKHTHYYTYTLTHARRQTNTVCLTCTYPHTFRIVFESGQSFEDSLSVLLPLSFAEDYF